LGDLFLDHPKDIKQFKNEIANKEDGLIVLSKKNGNPNM